jgi:nucleotide-binding universal stress UspA family protein
MTATITCGYNGSPVSTEAVMWAADEAAQRQAALLIVLCYDIPVSGAVAGPWFTADTYDAVHDSAQQRIETVAAKVREAHPDLAIELVATEGPASAALVADVKPSDMVVVGASDHEGASAFWLGSTARAVARKSPCPVVVVRGAGLGGRPDRIVVGADGSRTSAAAVRWAADEADLHGVPLTIVHSWSYPYHGMETSSAQARDLTEIDAACVLEQAVADARARCGADVEGLLIENGPASGLLNSVRDGDLLVLGTHGRGALANSFFGSTVNGVLDQAAIPVVIVPSDAR